MRSSVQNALQIGVLVLVGVLIAEVVFWSIWSENYAVLGALIAALVGYAGFLSLTFLEDENAWAKTIFRETWNRLLTRSAGVVTVNLVLVALVLVMGFLVSEARYVDIEGTFSLDAKPIDEALTYTVRYQGGHEGPYSSTDGRFKVRLPRESSGTRILLQAGNKQISTQGAVEITLGANDVALQHRDRLLIEVLNRKDPAFVRSNIRVRARDAAASAAEPTEMQTDQYGYARFEAPQHSIWQVSVIKDNVYTTTVPVHASSRTLPSGPVRRLLARRAARGRSFRLAAAH